MPSTHRTILLIDGNNWYQGLKAIDVDDRRWDEQP